MIHKRVADFLEAKHPAILHIEQRKQDGHRLQSGFRFLGDETYLTVRLIPEDYFAPYSSVTMTPVVSMGVDFQEPSACHLTINAKTREGLNAEVEEVFNRVKKVFPEIRWHISDQNPINGVRWRTRFGSWAEGFRKAEAICEYIRNSLPRAT